MSLRDYQQRAVDSVWDDLTTHEEGNPLVVLPTGNRLCKSGNRAIEAIRRGLFPVCGPLPAYADLGVYVGRIDDGVDWALSHREEAIKRVRAAQDYVRDEYAPSRIGKLWLEVLNYV